MMKVDVAKYRYIIKYPNEMPYLQFPFETYIVEVPIFLHYT